MLRSGKSMPSTGVVSPRARINSDYADLRCLNRYRGAPRGVCPSRSPLFPFSFICLITVHRLEPADSSFLFFPFPSLPRGHFDIYLPVNLLPVPRFSRFCSPGNTQSFNSLRACRTWRGINCFPFYFFKLGRRFIEKEKHKS